MLLGRGRSRRFLAAVGLLPTGDSAGQLPLGQVVDLAWRQPDDGAQAVKVLEVRAVG